MYIKICKLSDNPDERGNYPVITHIGYEANKYSLIDTDIKGEPSIDIFIEKDDKILWNNRFPKWQVSIYVMNSNGKTIDTFEWHGIKPPEMR